MFDFKQIYTKNSLWTTSKAVFVYTILIFFISCETSNEFRNGMVVSASNYASEAGIEIMKKGGNAFDAAVTTGFVLAVTHPQAGNIGGGGFMVAYSSDGKPFTLDFREMAPARAHRNMFLGESGEVIKDQSLYTHLSSGVPGTVDGLINIYKSHGTGLVSLAEIMQPAIDLAKNGFPISEHLSEVLNENRDRLINDPGSKKIFIKQDNTQWKAGDILIQKDLAKTLQRIADNGRDEFYSGETADLIVKEIQTNGGWITGRDLKNYTSIYRAPVYGSFLDYDIFTMGPPSSGGALLLEMLNMLNSLRLDLSEMEHNSAEYIHLLTEVQRRAYADRSKHFGDPDFYNVPLDSLLSLSYAKSRISNFDPLKKTPSAKIEPGDLFINESDETTHYSVIDKEKNCVSITYTLNTNFGSGLVVDGAGFLLNNEMDDFSSKPGVPNYFGLIGNEGNAIEPGKRPLSSMSPTIVLKENEPVLILGSPGGSRIITTILQVALNEFSFNKDLGSNLSAGRFHSQWLPDEVYLEDGHFDSVVMAELEEKGHKVVIKELGYFGAVNAIKILNGALIGGPDPRRDNSAAGY